MVEKIAIEDPRLAARVERIVDQLREYYPDGVIYQLEQQHKSLSNKVGEVWPIVGYGSRRDFLRAYGFETRKNPAHSSIDSEEILAELDRRYEGKPKPKSLEDLRNENPDLIAKTRTLACKSNEIFGKSLAKVLKERGLIVAAPSARDIEDTEIQEMLDALADKYRDASVKPVDVRGLKAANPEYGTVITAFLARCGSMYSMTPKKKLVELGICDSGAKGAGAVCVSADEIENAIDELGHLLCDVPAAERPADIVRLAKLYPEQGAFIKAGQKQGKVDKKSLQELGILAPTKAFLRKRGVRRVPVEDLLEDFSKATGMAYVEPDGKGADLLPPYVCGMDIANGIELRSALITTMDEEAEGLEVGQVLDVDILGEGWVQIDDPISQSRVWGTWGWFFDREASSKNSSRLLKHKGAEVVAVSTYDESRVVQIEMRYPAALRSDTLVYVLRELGIVRDSDVVGDMGWRFRLRRAAAGDAVRWERQEEAPVAGTASTPVEDRAERAAEPRGAEAAGIENPKPSPAPVLAFGFSGKEPTAKLAFSFGSKDSSAHDGPSGLPSETTGGEGAQGDCETSVLGGTSSRQHEASVQKEQEDDFADLLSALDDMLNW